MAGGLSESQLQEFGCTTKPNRPSKNGRLQKKTPNITKVSLNVLFTFFELIMIDNLLKILDPDIALSRMEAIEAARAKQQKILDESARDRLIKEQEV